MIELLPRDQTKLSEEDELVLAALYDEFDRTSQPVDRVEVAFKLKGVATNVAGRMSSGGPLAPYIVRARDGSERYAPTLRAAIRLWKTNDLNAVWTLYQRCYDGFRPNVRELPIDRAVSERLQYLINQEWFASIRILPNGDGVVIINESILDAPNLSSYLARRSGAEIQTTIERPQPALVALTSIRLTGFRSFASAAIDGLGALTVFAGPNEAGKTNLLTALKFMSACASDGLPAAQPRVGNLNSLWRRAENVSKFGIQVGMSVSPKRPFMYSLVIERGLEHQPYEGLSEYWDSQDALDEPAGRRSTGWVDQNRAHAKALTDDEKPSYEKLSLSPGDTLLANLRDIQKFKTAISIREALRSWSFYAFEPSALRQPANGVTVLRPDGANLPAALHDLGRRDPKALERVAQDFQDLLPEAQLLSTETSLLGSPILRLRERGLTDPLTHVDFSDGMLRILALLCLAHDPTPPSLVCIEEPENGLYSRLLEATLEVLRALSTKTQVFLTTHSVTLLNRVQPHEVVFVQRDENGSNLMRLDSRADITKFADRMGVGDQVLSGNVEAAT